MKRRYKDTNWPRLCNRREMRLKAMAGVDAPRPIMIASSRELLQAHYRGPWRAIGRLIQQELKDLFDWYCGDQWEWTRVHILRRQPDPLRAEERRMYQELRALEALAKDIQRPCGPKPKAGRLP
jgi:hypothetical protein